MHPLGMTELGRDSTGGYWSHKPPFVPMRFHTSCFPRTTTTTHPASVQQQQGELYSYRSMQMQFIGNTYYKIKYCSLTQQSCNDSCLHGGCEVWFERGWHKFMIILEEVVFHAVGFLCKQFQLGSNWLQLPQKDKDSVEKWTDGCCKSFTYINTEDKRQ